MEFIFWASAVFVFYTYLGYPALVLLWARYKAKPISKESIHPDVTVVISAFNEEHRIKARIENLLSQNYPAEKISIVIVSDGSTDRTVETVRSFNDDRLTLIELEENLGKALAVNRGVEAATGEIVIFADVRQRFDENVFQYLTSPFADPAVGGATGELVLMSSGNDQEPEGVGLYWKYEKAIRDAESSIDSTVGATGAIYAIRRELYEPLPGGVILDDVLTPLRIIKKGFRICMVREALAFDSLSGTGSEEFGRKVRTLAGNFQLMQAAPWVNNPFANRLFFQWVSHKVCRLFSPYALILLLISSWMISKPLYSAFGVLQLLAYLAAGFGCYAMWRGKKVRIIGTAASFLMLNMTAVVGLYSVLTGQTSSLWKKH